MIDIIKTHAYKVHNLESQYFQSTLLLRYNQMLIEHGNKNVNSNR